MTQLELVNLAPNFADYLMLGRGNDHRIPIQLILKRWRPWNEESGEQNYSIIFVEGVNNEKATKLGQLRILEKIGVYNLLFEGSLPDYKNKFAKDGHLRLEFAGYNKDNGRRIDNHTIVPFP